MVVAMAAVVLAAVARANVPMVVVTVAVRITAVAVAVAVRLATTIAMVNSSRLARKTRVLHRVKAAAVVLADRAWVNRLVLQASRARPARRQANPILCAPAWI